MIDGLSAAFEGAPVPLRVLVECNTGADRCGLATPHDAATLARRIADAPGLQLHGLMTYPPANGAAAVQAFMTQAKALIEADGLVLTVVSSGGTPSMMQAGDAPVATEYRPGTHACNDRSLVARGVCPWDDCALSVLATVVSVPSANRAIIATGSKALTSDLLGLTGYGHVLGRPDIAIDQLSEEHGRLISAGPIGLAVGDKLRIVPNHACVVSNLFDAVHVLEGGRACRDLAGGGARQGDISRTRLIAGAAFASKTVGFGNEIRQVRHIIFRAIAARGHCQSEGILHCAGHRRGNG